ncbi:MAG TPA: site-2 protease family protein [Solirubrobacterales bacterium]|nr:site-2 protease family protein [Solirubrobacterales bacterium]
MSWLLAIGGICLLVILHEAGHFVAAKATGMRVEKFFLFLGPKLFSVKRGETEYGIASIPIGGYVKITGMTSEEEVPPEALDRAYYRQPVWKRIVVIGAGPAVNIVLGFAILFVVALTSASVPTQSVREVVPKTPAAGVLKPGDKILAVDGHRYPGLDSEARIERFRDEIGTHRCAGKQEDGCTAATPVTMTIKRDGQVVKVSADPEYSAAAKQTLVGFSFDSRPVAIGVATAVSRAGNFGWLIVKETSKRIARIFNSKERKEITGIVGASDVTHQAVQVSAAAALTFLAVISLSLGLINLFPFLPLDGGHIFWSLVEKVRGEPVSLRVMELASVLGIILVAMLFVIGLTNDIGRLTGEGFHVR